MDLYISDESLSHTGKHTCDYEAMTAHAFKQPEPVGCDWDAMNQHADSYKYDPMYMKKKKPSNMILTFNA